MSKLTTQLTEAYSALAIWQARYELAQTAITKGPEIANEIAASTGAFRDALKEFLPPVLAKKLTKIKGGAPKTATKGVNFFIEKANEAADAALKAIHDLVGGPDEVPDAWKELLPKKLDPIKAK